MTAPRPPPVLAVRGATKRFGAVLALDDVDLEVAPRRGARAARRQRRRQVDADQVHQRRAPPRRGHDRDRRRAGRHPVARRGPGAAASRPSTRTSRCSTTSTRPPTSTPAARSPARAGCRAACAVLEPAGDGRRDHASCSTGCRSALPDTSAPRRPDVGRAAPGRSPSPGPRRSPRRSSSSTSRPPRSACASRARCSTSSGGCATRVTR